MASTHFQSDETLMLQATLTYAGYRWRVFPCHTATDGGCSCGKPSCEHIGKHPRFHLDDLPHGVTNAATDAQQIRRWWTRWPDANIGIATGAKSGLGVLDVDPNEGGALTLEDLLAEHGPLPETVESLTGGGGRHLLFRHSGVEIKNSASKLGAGLDIRGDGGYIIAPPSVHASGSRYEWEVSSHPHDVPLAPMPAWLLELVTASQRAHAASNGHDEAGGIISEGQRNDTLASLAGSMRHRGMTEEEIYAALAVVNAQRCQPPLADEEVRGIARSVARYEPTATSSPRTICVPLTGDPATWHLSTVVAHVSACDRLTEMGSAITVSMVYQNADALARVPDTQFYPIESTLQELLGRKLSPRKLEKAIKAHRNQAASQPKDQKTAIGSVLHDAPAINLVMPYPYEIEDGHLIVGHTDSAPIIVAYVPIIITGRLKDITTGLERLRLDWKRNGTWEYTVTDRRNALEGRQLLTLTNKGFPVAEHHAKELAKYFAMFEECNYAVIPQARITTHLGWQGRDGELGFMFGKTTITPDGEVVNEIRVDEAPPSDWKEDWVSFYALTEGESELAHGLQCSGEMSQWLETMKILKAYPKAILAVYASLAAPLLEIVKAPSFIIDWSNPTSEGKTTALRAGVSVWGYPQEDSPNSLLHTWNNSLVWVERASGVLHGIPICLDDTSQAKPEEVNRVIYMFAGGTGRGRGTPGGLAATRHWKTIMLSTGEQPIIAFTQNDGARMRVLCLRGMPFGAKNEATKEAVDHVNLALLSHYGHAGQTFVRWLLQNKARWDEFRHMYQEARASLIQQVNDAAAFRLSEYAAVINLAGKLAHEALALPWEYSSAITAEMWRGIIDQISGVSAPERALRHVMSVAYSRETAFQGRAMRDRSGEEIEPHGGWLGKWELSDWDRIAFYPHVLKKILRDEGFPEEGILSAWKEKGWLHIEKGRRGYERNVWMGNGTARMIMITKGAIDEVCEEPDSGSLTDVESTHDWDHDAREELR